MVTTLLNLLFIIYFYFCYVYIALQNICSWLACFKFLYNLHYTVCLLPNLLVSLNIIFVRFIHTDTIAHSFLLLLKIALYECSNPFGVPPAYILSAHCFPARRPGFPHHCLKAFVGCWCLLGSGFNSPQERAAPIPQGSWGIDSPLPCSSGGMTQSEALVLHCLLEFQVGLSSR